MTNAARVQGIPDRREGNLMSTHSFSYESVSLPRVMDIYSADCVHGVLTKNREAKENPETGKKLAENGEKLPQLVRND